MRHTLNGHIADTHLIGVVGTATLQPGAFHRYASLHADGNGHIDDFCRLQELLCAGDGIVVDNTGGTQTLHAGGIDRSGGGIRGEGIGSVNVVIDVLGYHRRENRGFQYLF